MNTLWQTAWPKLASKGEPVATQAQGWGGEIRIKTYGAHGDNVPLLEITNTLPVPQFEGLSSRDGLNAARQAYREQAEAIVAAMARTLPGGLMVALCIAHLEHERRVYIVPDVKADK